MTKNDDTHIITNVMDLYRFVEMLQVFNNKIEIGANAAGSFIWRCLPQALKFALSLSKREIDLLAGESPDEHEIATCVY